MSKKYIFITGGVISTVGKGVTAASIGALLKSQGFNVTSVKCDPYVNIDAGTMNPTEHGEVFVTDDGVETDQDIGHYERFLHESLGRENYLTTGQVYQEVIRRERNLEYDGKCVEVVPHVPEEIIRRIKLAERKAQADITIVEIGGTVGEYQNILFLEADRMLKLKSPRDVINIHVSYLPVPKTVGEMKTKPVQYSVRSLNSAGIQPEFVIGRSELPLDEKRKEKISVFCGVKKDFVISAPDVEFIYELPLIHDKQKLGEKILEELGLKSQKGDLNSWKKLMNNIRNAKKEVRIGIVGKYFDTGDFTLEDSYISVIEAIKHAAWVNNRKPKVFWIDSKQFERDHSSLSRLKEYDGIIVPGGFGARGIEGKIAAIQFVRENKIPYLGLCYGMQLACVEFARNVLGFKDANTTEINPKTKHPVIDILPEQKKNIKEKHYGATMRLGAYPCKVKDGSKAYKAYATSNIFERHRHRYEFNNDYKEEFEKKGVVFSGIYTKRNLVEIVELLGHPWFLGTQFHPELKSRPLEPHPLYREFVRACIKN